MSQPESAALGRVAALLLLASVVRWAALAGAPGSTPPQDGEVLSDLAAESAALAREAERRRAPLSPGERIDPNRAPGIELDRLPGVGPATAEAMVADRQSRGPFQRAEDLLRVRGVGPALLERIRPHLDLSDPPGRPVAPPGRRGPRSPGSAAGVSGVSRGVVTAAAPGGRERLDLNRADTLELRELPGVGPALARRIAEARRGAPFRSVEDLLRVRGIGPATVERLRPLVTVGR